VQSIKTAAAVLNDKRRILVFTGAGISTESGIPDFRGPNGVWTRVDPGEFTIDKYLRNPETRKRSWRMRLESGTLTAKPNKAHRAVTKLWRTGRMLGCVTQNIDGLHQKAGLPAEALVEMHGNVHMARCIGCGDRQPTSDVVARVKAGEEDPSCLLCGGILKIDIVLFGEMLSPAATDLAFELAYRADAVVCVGSTLSVFPAAQVPLEVAQAGHPLVILNKGGTAFDHLAAACIDGPAGKMLPALVSALS
jgi:NAD-dependent deacetylase